MRAAVFKQAGQPLVIEQRPDPTPGPGEVVVKVGRCGICGSDLHMTEPDNRTMVYPPNSLFGHEYSGEVVAVGSQVDNLRVKDRIAAYSMIGCGRCATCLAGLPKWCRDFRGVGTGFAEYSLANARDSVKLPSGLSLADGALVEPLATGLHGVALANLTPGARVLVLGAGPVGLATIYWARRLGAGRIAAMARSTQRAELAQELGATYFVCADKDAGAAVRTTLGGPPEVVFECVGQPNMLMQACGHVQERGSVISMGFCMAADPIMPSLATWKEITIRFSFAYSAREYQLTVDTLAAGHVEPRHMVTDTISLDQLPATFDALRTRTPQCKVLVDPWA